MKFQSFNQSILFRYFITSLSLLIQQINTMNTSNYHVSNQNGDADEWTTVTNNRKKRSNNNNVSNVPKHSSPSAVYRPPIPSSDYDYNRENKTSYSGKFFKSRYSSPKSTRQPRQIPSQEILFYKLRDKEFITGIENGSFNSKNILKHMTNIEKHDDLSKMTKELAERAVTDTFDKFLYSAIIRMNLKKHVMDDYVKLIVIIINKLRDRNEKKIGNYKTIKKFDEASGLMWLDDDIDPNAISLILKKLFNDLHTDPFKPNANNENLFGSLIAKLKKGTMSEEIFDTRYSLLLESINSVQRKRLIQAVINKITTDLAYNSESMIKFKMLFLINPAAFIQETLYYFLKNNNNMYSNMENAVESLYAPKFVQTLENLFVDYSADKEYMQIVESLSLTPLFKNAQLINKDEFFTIVSNIIIGYCDTNNKTCIVNFGEDDDQENDVTIRARLLSLAYLVSELAKLNLCENLVDNVVKLFKDNDKIKNNICFDVCHCILKTRPLNPNAYIDLLKRQNKSGFAGVKLYTLAEHLSSYCDVYKNNQIINIDIILNCLQEIIDTKNTNKAELETCSAPSTPTKNRKRKNKKRNKHNNAINTVTPIVQQEKQLCMSAPSTPFNVISPRRDTNVVSYFPLTSKFDDSVVYEDLSDEAIVIIKNQLRLDSDEKVFSDFFDEVLSKSRVPITVKTHVTNMVCEVIDAMVGLGIKKDTIRRLIIDANRLVEEKKDDLPCVVINYDILKENITQHLDIIA